jgi:hypothetical protein
MVLSILDIDPTTTVCLHHQMVKIASLQSGGSGLGIGYTCH